MAVAGHINVADSSPAPLAVFTEYPVNVNGVSSSSRQILASEPFWLIFNSASLFVALEKSMTVPACA